MFARIDCNWKAKAPFQFKCDQMAFWWSRKNLTSNFFMISSAWRTTSGTRRWRHRGPRTACSIRPCNSCTPSRTSSTWRWSWPTKPPQLSGEVLSTLIKLVKAVKGSWATSTEFDFIEKWKLPPFTNESIILLYNLSNSICFPSTCIKIGTKMLETITSKHYVRLIRILCYFATAFHEISSKSEANCLKQSPPKNVYLFKPQLTCPTEREHNLLFGSDVFY